VEAVVDVLATKSMSALDETGLNTLVVAGGVGANVQLRARLEQETRKRGAVVFFPPPSLCTDNGAMIALARQAEAVDARLAERWALPCIRWSLAEATADHGRRRWPASGDRFPASHQVRNVAGCL
jgi:N6-L-threonylcarbamoyladenine synthase